MNALLVLLLIVAIGASGCSKGNNMGVEDIDYSSLAFECTEEVNPPFDEDADKWYRTARNLQKQDESGNAAEIVDMYQKAVKKDHYNAMHRLALMYIDGIGVERNEKRAVELVRRVVEMDVPSGYYQMGVFLQQGIGVKQDEAASLTYMRRAADMGNPQAQYAIGRKLLDIRESEVRPKVIPIGEAMLQCALQQGLGDAGYKLGKHYLIGAGKTSDGLAALQAAARLGHNQSLFSLRRIFSEGQYGIGKDPERAACYARLESESDADKAKTFPDIDRICPLPPKRMP